MSAEADGAAAVGTIHPGTLVIAAGHHDGSDPADWSPRSVAIDRVATRLIDLAAPATTADLDTVLGELDAGGVVVARPDAGMPAGRSASAASLVQAADRAGHPVVVVPGPDPVIAALAGSGLDVDRFVVDSDLPRDRAERMERLQALVDRGRAVALPVAPASALALLAELQEVAGPDLAAVVAIDPGTATERIERGRLDAPAMEIPDGATAVIVLAPVVADPQHHSDDDLRRALATELAAGASRRDAVDAVAAATGEPRRRVYELAVSLP
ncbi:MAG: SAM-dependent methyltransferase [Actinomycetota bacterium]